MQHSALDTLKKLLRDWTNSYVKKIENENF